MPETTPLQALLDSLPQHGRVEWIGIRPARGEPMQAINRVAVTPGKGLDGDRFKGRARAGWLQRHARAWRDYGEGG